MAKGARIGGKATARANLDERRQWIELAMKEGAQVTLASNEGCGRGQMSEEGLITHWTGELSLEARPRVGDWG